MFSILLIWCRLPKPIKKTLDTLCKMFSKFDGVKLSSQLTVVLSSNVDFDVHQLKLWNKDIMSIVEVYSLLRYLCVFIIFYIRY